MRLCVLKSEPSSLQLNRSWRKIHNVLTLPILCLFPLTKSGLIAIYLVLILETWVRSLGWEDPLEEEMATHSSILAWKIPQTEEPDGLQSTGSQGRTRQRVHARSHVCRVRGIRREEDTETI